MRSVVEVLDGRLAGIANTTAMTVGWVERNQDPIPELAGVALSVTGVDAVSVIQDGHVIATLHLNDTQTGWYAKVGEETVAASPTMPSCLLRAMFHIADSAVPDVELSPQEALDAMESLDEPDEPDEPDSEQAPT